MRKVIVDNIRLDGLCLTELFDLSDVEVRGYFDCTDNNLTSLKGSPHTVDGFFVCYNNPLTSLKGIPKTVYGNFYIGRSLEAEFSEEYIRSLCNIEGYIVYR